MTTARKTVVDPIERPDGHTDRDGHPQTDIERDLRFCLDYMTEMEVEADAKDCDLTNAQSLIRELRRDIWRRTAAAAAAAERNKPAPEWVALWRAVRRTDWPYQTILKWCVQGIIEARKPAGRWEVEMNSLLAKIATLRDAPVPPPKRRLIVP
jgi:hypothetical protein